MRFAAFRATTPPSFNDISPIGAILAYSWDLRRGSADRLAYRVCDCSLMISISRAAVRSGQSRLLARTARVSAPLQDVLASNSNNDFAVEVHKAPKGWHGCMINSVPGKTDFFTNCTNFLQIINDCGKSTFTLA